MKDQSISQKPPKPPALLRLKAVLRRAECETYMDSDDDNGKDRRKAAGRFGKLASKERRPWHNFADPSLLGEASPSNEPVWGVLDRARIVDLKSVQGQAVAVLEFRGDAFVQQQIRRLVGTAVAVAHQWLSESIMIESTRSDSFSEMPLAPAFRLYLAGSRFHFAEMRAAGQSLFDTNVCGPAAKLCDLDDNIRWVQEALLGEEASGIAKSMEEEWLRNLGATVAPTLKRSPQVEESIIDDRGPAIAMLAQSPPDYQLVPTLLRAIIAAGEWPETSIARSNVIRALDRTKARGKAGSFAVLNADIEGFDAKGDVSLGSQLFPRLSKAIFDLEAKVAKQERGLATWQGMQPNILNKRQPSSHCAVNCNAIFTPHVDSGQGFGQRLSLIVGLGDYAGGELSVEGNDFDIRYKPLEFDGWKLRHWTRKFQGERLSLVWFTPER